MELGIRAQYLGPCPIGKSIGEPMSRGKARHRCVFVRLAVRTSLTSRPPSLANSHRSQDLVRKRHRYHALQPSFSVSERRRRPRPDLPIPAARSLLKYLSRAPLISIFSVYRIRRCSGRSPELWRNLPRSGDLRPAKFFAAGPCPPLHLS